MKVKIVRVDKALPLPEYKTEGAVAFDLYSREDKTLAPGESALLPSNYIIEVPAGYALLIAARSSTHKKGLRLSNGLGVIDQDYHGPEDEVRLAVYNFSSAPVEVKRGDRLAQGMIVPVLRPAWQEVEKIKNESRGGFGSTG